jgi:uncharacterized protein YndB with AHSA1/START domain
MWQQQYQVTIDAPPAAVWQVLTDLARYSEWNRYAISARGDLRPGGEVEIVVRLGSGQQRVDNRVTDLSSEQRLCWESLNWYRVLVYGVRCRFLEPGPDGSTVFREVETMHGLLAPVIKAFMATPMLDGLRRECESLKAEVERRQHQ